MDGIRVADRAGKSTRETGPSAALSRAAHTGSMAPPAPTPVANRIPAKGVRFVKTCFQPSHAGGPSATPARSISITIGAAMGCPFLAAFRRSSSCRSRWNSLARWDS